jgi:hypothetical protein
MRARTDQKLITKKYASGSTKRRRKTRAAGASGQMALGTLKLRETLLIPRALASRVEGVHDHPHPKLAIAFRVVELRPPRKGEVGPRQQGDLRA